jgi:hypothetical protein
LIIRLEPDGWWRDENGECYGKGNYELLCTIIREFAFSTADSHNEIDSIINSIDAKEPITIDTEH